MQTIFEKTWFQTLQAELKIPINTDFDASNIEFILNHYKCIIGYLQPTKGWQCAASKWASETRSCQVCFTDEPYNSRKGAIFCFSPRLAFGWKNLYIIMEWSWRVRSCSLPSDVAPCILETYIGNIVVWKHHLYLEISFVLNKKTYLICKVLNHHRSSTPPFCSKSFSPSVTFIPSCSSTKMKFKVGLGNAIESIKCNVSILHTH